MLSWCLKQFGTAARTLPAQSSRLVVPSVHVRRWCGKSKLNSYKNLEVSKSEAIMTISINRPSVRNCVNHATAKELGRAFLDFETDPDVSVGILQGKGGNFCAGYDLGELAAYADAQARWKEVQKDFDFVNGHAPMGPSRLALSKPVIAAVSGYAVAGGLELSLLCDLRVAETDSYFGVLCRKHGVPLLDGGTVRLQKLIGLSRALDLILTGRVVSAEEGYRIGLVNKMAPKGESYEIAVELAKEIAKFPQKCMQADRASTYYAAFAADDLEDALKFEFTNGVGVVPEESIPGAKKFINRNSD